MAGADETPAPDIQNPLPATPEDPAKQPPAGLGPGDPDSARVEPPTEEQRKDLAAKGIFYDDTNGCYIETGGKQIKNADGSYKTAEEILNPPKVSPADAPAGPAPAA